jgi:hypothetical protein
MLALRPLPDKIRQLVIPILDVAAPAKSADRANAHKYVLGNITRMGKVAAGFDAAFIDSSELHSAFRLPAAVHPLSAAASALADAGARVIPVTGLHRDAAHHEVVLDIHKVHPQEQLCLRLDATDVSTATRTYNRVRDFLATAAVTTEQAYLLLDLQCLHGCDDKAVVALVTRLLKLVKNSTWAGIIVGGYGVPDQLATALSTNEQTYLPRIEQSAFREVAAHNWGSPLWFADYTIVSPAVVELDWRLIRKVMTPRALYALDESWFVVRGGAFSSHQDGYRQYYAIADEIVALDEFSGEDYSAGDKYIWERAQREGTPGSPASWITAGVNHHITFTAGAHEGFNSYA